MSNHQQSDSTLDLIDVQHAKDFNRTLVEISHHEDVPDDYTINGETNPRNALVDAIINEFIEWMDGSMDTITNIVNDTDPLWYRRMMWELSELVRVYDLTRPDEEYSREN